MNHSTPRKAIDQVFLKVFAVLFLVILGCQAVKHSAITETQSQQTIGGHR